MSEPTADSALAALQGAIAAAVRGHFGDRFAAADLADLDRVSLANDDEPDVVFSVCDDPMGG